MNFIEQMLTGPLNRVHSVYRYSARSVHKQESVAEHSYFVALYAIMIGDYLDLKYDTERVLRRAITHDLDESVTGDFVRSFKYYDNEFRHQLHTASGRFLRQILDGYPPVIQDYYTDWYCAKDSTIEGELIRVADFMSVVAYILREWAMGNRTLNDIVDEIAAYGLSVMQITTYPRLQDFVHDALTLLREEVENEVNTTYWDC